ncbi:MAG: type II secretion system protein GspM [Tabrizicola sp.]|jgi:hypothetical protein|nr:type II secretion system protein GspM [Tabrizicola sp.]
MIRPQSIASRLLALATLFAFVLCLGLFGIGPLSEWRSGILQRSSTTLEDIQQLDLTVEALTAEVRALSGTQSLDLMWSAEQSGQASALVQGRLSDLARAQGLSLRSIAPLPNRDLPVAEGVGFRIELEAALDRLVPFLIAVEHSKPLLVIERATLRRLARPGETNASGGSGPLQPELFVQLDIIAPVQLNVAKDGDDT